MAEDNDNKQAGATLATEPVATDPGKGKGKAKGKKANKAQQVRKPAASGPFSQGDKVLFHVKHLHGLHGTVLGKLEDGSYMVRGGEENIEGHAFNFTGDQLESAKGVDLDEHHSTRLEWDYKD